MALPVRHGDRQQVHEYPGGARFLSLSGGATVPPADLEETDDAYVVEVELPGVKREDINVEVSGRRLSVSGERKERERTGILRRSTRPAGGFEHTVLFAGEVDEESIEATLDKGVLTVQVPKRARATRADRRVEQRRGRLDERVGLMAVTLALRGDEDSATVAPELMRAAGHNRTAVLRALARLQANNPRLGPIGQRAAEALRLAAAMLDGDAPVEATAEDGSSSRRTARTPRAGRADGVVTA